MQMRDGPGENEASEGPSAGQGVSGGDALGNV
jgi:hypothetical protein